MAPPDSGLEGEHRALSANKHRAGWYSWEQTLGLGYESCLGWHRVILGLVNHYIPMLPSLITYNHFHLGTTEKLIKEDHSSSTPPGSLMALETGRSTLSHGVCESQILGCPLTCVCGEGVTPKTGALPMFLYLPVRNYLSQQCMPTVLQCSAFKYWRNTIKVLLCLIIDLLRFDYK